VKDSDRGDPMEIGLGEFGDARLKKGFLGENCGRLGVHVRWRRAATT
jgi:hypothetical protein